MWVGEVGNILPPCQSALRRGASVVGYGFGLGEKGKRGTLQARSQSVKAKDKRPSPVKKVSAQLHTLGEGERDVASGGWKESGATRWQ